MSAASFLGLSSFGVCVYAELPITRATRLSASTPFAESTIQMITTHKAFGKSGMSARPHLNVRSLSDPEAALKDLPLRT